MESPLLPEHQLAIDEAAGVNTGNRAAKRRELQYRQRRRRQIRRETARIDRTIAEMVADLPELPVVEAVGWKARLRTVAARVTVFSSKEA